MTKQDDKQNDKQVETTVAFSELGLSDAVMRALDDIGYKTPSPIQAKAIPEFLTGGDILGQAQTGTGKTAAFALPLLTNINLAQRTPQAMILVPTRELALQVTEAIESFSAHMPKLNMIALYGGQGYREQLQALKRGVHIIVGTPGRVMDHMRRGTLKLDELRTLILDEADEMLRMGFIDDVDWILSHTPEDRQVGLFSATMPPQIKRIANSHLQNPTEVVIKAKTNTADTIRQRYWLVQGLHKLDGMCRILEAETFDGIIVFVRTKAATEELAVKLEARGFASAALNGDIQQNQRERTVDRLKRGELDILVATDVVARGLDVERISHVINYDLPQDPESYTHRIGRTGRAGRTGDAISFVAPREQRMLKTIERVTRGKVEQMQLPTADSINAMRIDRLKESIKDAVTNEKYTDDIMFYSALIADLQKDSELEPQQIAAGLARLLQGKRPFLLKEVEFKQSRRRDLDEKPQNRNRKERQERRTNRRDSSNDEDMATYRVEVGRRHGVKPGNLVGAIANEAGLDSQFIGRIAIQDNFTLIDLPEGMPKPVMAALKKVWVAGQQLRISVDEGSPTEDRGGRDRGGNDERGGRDRGGRDRGGNDNRDAAPSRDSDTGDKPARRRPRSSGAGAGRNKGRPSPNHRGGGGGRGPNRGGRS